MSVIRWSRRRVARAAQDGERGASLILALAFLTLFGALLVTLLGFVQVAFLANSRVHQQGLTRYAMAGAIDASVQRARKEQTMGVTSCGTPMVYAGATVACTPLSGDGGLIPGGTAPWNAILTVGGDITNTTANSTLAVNGPVYANGAISLTGSGSKLDAADLPVKGTACNGDTASWKYAQPIVSCPPINGAYGPPAEAGVAPNYASGPLPSLGTAVTAADVQCKGPAGARYFEYKPGFYNDVTNVLKKAANLCVSDSDRAVARYFTAGVYYFDLSTTWLVDDGIPVIGGTAGSWLGVGSPPDPALPTAPDAQPTACVRDVPNGGVQFVFGNASRWTVAAGSRVELCPDPGQIVLYGQTATGTESVALTPTGTNPGATTCPATYTYSTPNLACWNDPSRALKAESRETPPTPAVEATAVISEASTDPSAPLTVTGFPGALASIPSAWGSTSTAYDVTIEVPNAASMFDSTGAVKFTGGTMRIELEVGSAACRFVITGTANSSGGQTVSNLTTKGNPANNCLQAAVQNPFSITYRPQLLTQGPPTPDRQMRVALDGIKVTLTPTGTIAIPQDSGSNPFLTVLGPTSTATAAFAAWGPVYMKNAAFSVNLNSAVIFDRGVILKSLATQGGRADAPVFRVGGGRRSMLFDATKNGRQVQAVVTVTDYKTPGYWARVKRWNVKS